MSHAKNFHQLPEGGYGTRGGTTQEVEEVLSGDTVVLALIGKTWITATDTSGHRLIDSSASNNRLELETAFRARLRTIPVLVEGAEVPRESDLPDHEREPRHGNEVEEGVGA